MPIRVLLIDDDPKITALLERGLAYEGFMVYTAPSGELGLKVVKEQSPDVVLLDISMPGLDGFEVCQRLRTQGDLAVIMLTARDEVRDRVSALNLGADDYVAKPFAFDELVARIYAVLRRRRVDDVNLSYADLVLNPETREVTRAGQLVEVTAREYALLTMFVRHARKVLTREQILNQVWGYDAEVDTNVVEVHIGHLRQKLEAGGGKRLLQTVRGLGYVLRG